MVFTPHARSDTHLNTKPAVFLLSAPQDTSERDELTALLLDKKSGANVTVWHADAPPKKTDLPQLAHMSLFVIAVTENLIHGCLDQAADVISFARKENIPVLPVYYISPGRKHEDASRFYKCVTAAVAENKAGGKLIELDGPVYKAKDFKEQFFSKYLNLVVPDSIADEIRKDAFSKKLFLSYRKADREKALEIMKAVHKLPLCQSLAIWFDDFLIAGRDFNDEIRQQLTSSDAFLLAVTPSLLDLPNYVFKEEYPRAVECKPQKTIIPIQADDLDAEKFRDNYSKLPEKVPVWDEDSLKQRIDEALFFEDPPKEPSAKQKYLLGMAFLSGIMVEKDTDRALQLLTEAADEGEPDAALQLSYMYLARIGVPRNNEKALYWRQRAFTLAEKAAAGGNDEQMLETAYKSAFGRDGLVLMYFAADRQSEARDICSRLRSLLSRYPDNDRHALWYADSSVFEGDPHFDDPNDLTSEKLDTYRRFVQDGIDRLQKLDAGSEEVAFNLAQAHGVLSDIEKRLGNFDEAEKNILISQQIVKPLAERSVSLEFRELLAGTWEQLGFIYKLRFKYRDAAAAFSEVIPIRESLYAESEVPTYKEGLAYAYYNYGLVTEDLDDGAKKVEKAIALMEEVVSEDPEDVHMKMALDEMIRALKKQKRKPLVAKLITAGIILAFAAAVIAGLVGLIRAILE